MDPQNNFPYDIIDLGTFFKVGCRHQPLATVPCQKLPKKTLNLADEVFKDTSTLMVDENLNLQPKAKNLVPFLQKLPTPPSVLNNNAGSTSLRKQR